MNTPLPEADSGSPERVQLAQAFAFEENDRGLVSPELQRYLYGEGDNLSDRGYEGAVHKLWEEVIDAEEGSVEETVAARKLSEINLLRTAGQLQFGGKDKALWATRFTEANVELFGEVEPEIASSMLEGAVFSFLSVEADGDAKEAQDRIRERFGNGQERESNVLDILSVEQIEAIRDGLMQVHRVIIEVLSEAPEGPYTSAQVREYFREVLDKMAEDTPGTDEWELRNTPGKTWFSVIDEDRYVEVPDARPDVKDKSSLLALGLHEIGVHVVRAQSGYNHEDVFLALGIPGYDRIEEGIGVFTEQLVQGEIPQKVMDRYVDAALALGLIGDKPMSREELTQFVVDRETIRAAADGREMTDGDLTAAKTHVNRFFRGSDGNLHENAKGEVAQGIYVRDILYFQGLVDTHRYFKQQLEAGWSAVEIWNYLLEGKFNPYFETHEDHLKKKIAA